MEINTILQRIIQPLTWECLENQILLLLIYENQNKAQTCLPKDFLLSLFHLKTNTYNIDVHQSNHVELNIIK